jgi:hypothetical protein
MIFLLQKRLDLNCHVNPATPPCPLDEIPLRAIIPSRLPDASLRTCVSSEENRIHRLQIVDNLTGKHLRKITIPLLSKLQKESLKVVTRRTVWIRQQLHARHPAISVIDDKGVIGILVDERRIVNSTLSNDVSSKRSHMEFTSTKQLRNGRSLVFQWPVAVVSAVYE